MLGVQRSDLGIVGAGRGSVFGPVTLCFNSNTLSLDQEQMSVQSMMNGGNSSQSRLFCGEQPITIHHTFSTNVTVKNQGAQHILVVEKEGVFLNLIQSKIQEICPCIIVTGNGFPPLAVSIMFTFIVSWLRLQSLLNNHCYCV